MNNQKVKLYLIPTPIGNMDDITKRIIDTLNFVDVIFCEDTRSTSILLNYLNIKKKLISSHKFNENKNKSKIIDYLKSGKNVGIVSDRGTPIISDPGYILTQEVINNNYEVVALPGPTAFVPALIASGLSPQPFLFYGFLNSKRTVRKKEIEVLKMYTCTLIFYEAPHRLKETLEDLENILGFDRKVSISREITKKYEQIYYGTLGNIMNLIEEIRGEFVIVVEGNKIDNRFLNVSIDEHIKFYLEEGYDEKEAIKKVAKDRNLKKSDVYKYYHTKKNK